MDLSDIIKAKAMFGGSGGGGGGDYPIITATWHDDTEQYTYSCNWSFTELKAKLEEQTESNSWAGIYIEEAYDGAQGGTWSNGSERLTLFMSDGMQYHYRYDGTIIAES